MCVAGLIVVILTMLVLTWLQSFHYHSLVRELTAALSRVPLTWSQQAVSSSAEAQEHIKKIVFINCGLQKANRSRAPVGPNCVYAHTFKYITNIWLVLHIGKTQ